jgi:hypothetical protein
MDAVFVIARDNAIIGQRSQQAAQLGAVGVLQAEGAGDFTRSDIAGLRANEGNDLVPRREALLIIAPRFH